MKTYYKFEANGFKKNLLLVLFALLIVFPIEADTKDAIKQLMVADKEYAAGKYDRAVSTYESVMQMYGVSASTLYNLGNAYFKTGNIGRAMVCYERAHKLAPRNKQISNNLAYVSSKIADNNIAGAGKDKEILTPDAPSFLDSVHNVVAVETSSNSWALFAVISFILMLTAAAIYVFSTNVAARKAGFFSGLIFLLFTGIFISLAAYSAREFNSEKEGIVTAFKVTLKSEPEKDSKSVGPALNQGTKLEVVEARMNPDGKIGWYKVRLNSRLSGWIDSADYEVI